MLRASLNAEDCLGEALRAATGDEAPVRGASFAGLRLKRWLLCLQAPLVEVQETLPSAWASMDWARGFWGHEETAEDDEEAVVAEADREAAEALYWQDVFHEDEEAAAPAPSAKATWEEDDEGEEAEEVAAGSTGDAAPAVAVASQPEPTPIYTFGTEPTFVDYHLLATLRGLEFMYPSSTAEHLAQSELDELRLWRDRMLRRPRLAEFLSSAPPVLYEAVRGVA